MLQHLTCQVFSVQGPLDPRSPVLNGAREPPNPALGILGARDISAWVESNHPQKWMAKTKATPLVPDSCSACRWIPRNEHHFAREAWFFHLHVSFAQGKDTCFFHPIPTMKVDHFLFLKIRLQGTTWFFRF